MCTYNHEDYIVQAIEGVLEQKTNFPIELIIGEDYSTDKTRAIVKEFAEKYPDIITPILHEKNYGATYNLIHLITRSEADIIAICDGDDYWTDPLKLQKEYEFLSENNNIGMLCSKSRLFFQKKNRLEGYLGNANVETYEGLFEGYSDVSAPSLVFRKELMLQCIDDCQPLIEKEIFFDTPMALWFAYKSSIKYFDEFRSVYRRLENSASNITNTRKRFEFNKKHLYIKLFFISHFPPKSKESANIILTYLNEHLGSMMDYAEFMGETLKQKSYSYKIGNAILKPLKRVANIVKKEK